METEIRLISVNKLKPSKDNPRKTFDKEELQNHANSIKVHGIINPIEVDKNFEIVTGELRWRASKLAGLDKVPCKILSNISEQDLQFRRFVENFHRQKLKPEEYVPKLKKLWKVFSTEYKPRSAQDRGIAEFSRKLGMSERWVGDILQLEERAIPEVAAAFNKGELGIGIAREIANAPKPIQRELFKVAKRENEYRSIVREKIRTYKEVETILEPISHEKTPDEYVKLVSRKFLELEDLIPSDNKKRSMAIQRLSMKEHKEFRDALLRKMNNSLKNHIVPFYNELKASAH